MEDRSIENIKTETDRNEKLKTRKVSETYRPFTGSNTSIYSATKKLKRERERERTYLRYYEIFPKLM